jgi:hypothetical protein
MILSITEQLKITVVFVASPFEGEVNETTGIVIVTVLYL